MRLREFVERLETSGNLCAYGIKVPLIFWQVS